MKVIITGGSGFIGTALTSALIARGHHVSIIDRSPQSHHILPGVTYHHADLVTDRLKPEWFSGCDAIIHLAGRSLLGVWTPAYKQSLYDSRVVSARRIVEAMSHVSVNARPKVVVSANAIGYYGDRGDEVLDETSAPGIDFLARLCRDWQDAWVPLESHRTRIVTIRTGIVLDGTGGMMERLLPMFKYHLGARLGNGRQWFSWIGLADLLNVYIVALETDTFAGPVNAVAPRPLRNKEFTSQLAGALGKRAFLSVPAWSLRIIGSDIARTLLGSQRVVPTKLKEQNFHFETSTIRSVVEAQ